MQYAVYIEQIEKILREDGKEKINELLIDGTIVNKKSTENKLSVYIINAIVNQKVRILEYKKYILNGLALITEGTVIFGESISKKNILASLIKDKDIFAFYDIEELLDNPDFAKSISAGIDIQELTDILLELEREEFEGKEVFLCLLDEYITKAEDYLNRYDLIDFVEDLIDDVVEIYYQSTENDDYSPYEKALKELVNSAQDRILNEIFDLMINLTDYHIKDEIEKGLLDLITEKIESEIEEIIKWKVLSEPDDYPEYDRERHYDNSGGYDLDLILDRNIGE